MLISKTILTSSHGNHIVLFGDIHLPYIKTEEESQINDLISLIKNTPESLLLIEGRRPLGTKSLEIMYPEKAQRSSTNFMLLAEIEKTFKAENIPFINLSEKRPGEDYMSFFSSILNLTGQTIHYMNEEESIANITKELAPLCPQHMLGTVDEWYAHAQKEIAHDKASLKKINSTLLRLANLRIKEAEIFLTNAYKCAKNLRRDKAESFLKLIARSAHNNNKNATTPISFWDQLKWRIGWDTQTILAHRIFLHNVSNFNWRALGFAFENGALHYALADIDFATLEEIQNTRAKNLFITTGASHTIVIKKLLLEAGWNHVEETCSLFAQLPHAPIQELKKLPNETNDKEFLKIITLLSAQFGSAQSQGVYEVSQESKTAIGRKLNIFAQ
jgi:hypothetical protein